MGIAGNNNYTEITGTVQDLIYANSESGFAVIEFQPSGGGESIRASGIMPEVFPGELITLSGSMEIHRQYGETFRVHTLIKAMPSDSESLITFLACGLFSGVGEATAKAIVKMFGEETPDVILNEPERLSAVRGISSKKAEGIAETFKEYYNVSETLKFFADLGISTKVALAVYGKYGVNSVNVTCRNPYMLIDEVPQVGFKTADRIAVGIGVNQNSSSRVCAFIKYYLGAQLGFGNVCYPADKLLDSVAYELSVDRETAEEALNSLIAAGDCTLYGQQTPLTAQDAGAEKDGRREPLVFLDFIARCEEEIAFSLIRLSEYTETAGNAFRPFLKRFSEDTGIELNPDQENAVKAAVEHGFAVITGGPGTGKTTIIKAVYRYLSLTGLKCVLAAPTGRAAKRMSEAVGIEAKTIHRLLEYAAFGGTEMSDTELGEERRLKFNRNESNPLDADVIIIDEASMLDTLLAYHMLKALKPGTRLIMLGDKDQLPSVGPGNILKDIIASGRFTVVTLSYIYRQVDESLISLNAQRINNGELPEMNRRNRDFFMVDVADPAEVPGVLSDVVVRRLPKAYGIDPVKDIQVLIPGKKGECGVEAVNPMLQSQLNPKTRGTEELVFGETVFRENDRVMQIKNDYEIEWRSITDLGIEGKGIFNGEMGRISAIDRSERVLTVLFDEEREAEYPFELLNELELCYAITVHKSQGSEFDYCVIPLSGIPARLCTRNILYTAVTRARRMVVLVGDRRYIRYMVGNNTEEKRFTCLAERLRGGNGSFYGGGQ